jgi:hypothetical protein
MRVALALENLVGVLDEAEPELALRPHLSQSSQKRGSSTMPAPEEERRWSTSK